MPGTQVDYDPFASTKEAEATSVTPPKGGVIVDYDPFAKEEAPFIDTPLL